MYSFSYLEPVCCSMSSSNCWFLTCIQVSQEAGSDLVHWEDLEGSNGEGGGRGDQDGEYM